LSQLRLLGTMIAYGYPGLSLESEFDLVDRIGAEVVEILPNWSALPSPSEVRQQALDRGIRIHSAHGCWGGQSIKALRVDLASTDPIVHQASLDDLRRCLDWIEEADGSHLVIHPGGLSDPLEANSRRASLMAGLYQLIEHARTGKVTLCLENMPPGVWPGSRMSDLKSLVDEIDHPMLALAIDTGHAQMVSNPAEETRTAGDRLGTTHVHDNNGRRDTHQPPGEGVVDWFDWVEALDQVDYRGPIVLECIKDLRDDPTKMTRRFFEILDLLTGKGR